MDGAEYSERVFTTDNLELAAVFLTFGASLRKEPPIEWVEEYPSKDAYIDSLKGVPVNPKRVVAFNFLTDGVNVEAIAQSFNSRAAQDKFVALVRSSGLDQKEIDKILKAHSLALGATCRESMEARKYLIELVKVFPNRSKWIQVRGKGRGQVARFGFGTSKEMRQNLLSKIE